MTRGDSFDAKVGLEVLQNMIVTLDFHGMI